MFSLKSDFSFYDSINTKISYLFIYVKRYVLSVGSSTVNREKPHLEKYNQFKPRTGFKGNIISKCVYPDKIP